MLYAKGADNIENDGSIFQYENSLRDSEIHFCVKRNPWLKGVKFEKFS